MSTLNATNLKHASSGSNNIVLATDGSSAITTLSSTTIKHASSGTNNIVLDSSARTLMGGVTANANGGVLQLSSGITFPATAVAASDANTLDDYEEGTWTPTLFDAESGGNSATMTTQEGQYTKVGSTLTCYCRITWSGKGSMVSGNYIVIRGFPFTSKANTGGFNYLSPMEIANGSSLDSANFAMPGAFSLGVVKKSASGTLFLVSDLSSSGTLSFGITFLV